MNIFSFKMAENSLFAVLLRSPWWISVLVTAAIVLVSFVVLPPRFVIFGFAVALPFPIIAGVAAWRQWQAPSHARVQAVRDSVAAMNWKAFSAALEAAWRARGFEVERLEGGGADFELTQGWRKTVVSARRWKTAQLGVEPVKALLAEREAREAQAAMLISLGEVSTAASKLMTARGVELGNATTLAALLPRP
ncbi:MAG: restriction endonuclease [Burkholderiaceae bacterium]